MYTFSGLVPEVWSRRLSPEQTVGGGLLPSPSFCFCSKLAIIASRSFQYHGAHGRYVGRWSNRPTAQAIDINQISSMLLTNVFVFVEMLLIPHLELAPAAIQ
jgi:hypothetical protein